MKIKHIVISMIACLTIGTSCEKAEITTESLIGTYWTGTHIASDYTNGEHNDLGIGFDNVHADFTFLLYGDKDAETGVALYEAQGTTLKISKANSYLDGEWVMTYKKGLDMTLERQGQNNITHTITLRKRK